MQTRAMKADVFTIKALESKGYDVAELIKLNDKEIDELPISTRLIQLLKEYKARGGKTVQELLNEITDAMLTDSEPAHASDTIEEYKKNDNEKIDFVEELIKEKEQELVPEGEVKIVRKVASPEDIKIIQEALDKKVCKSLVTYIKHLKATVPEVILTSIDTAVLNKMIDDQLKKNKSTK